MNRLKKILRTNNGSSSFGTVAVVMFLILLVSTGCEFLRLNIIVQGTRDAMEAVVTQACTDNYETLYNELREGYSGGYKLDNGNWTENINTDDVYTIMDKQLGTHPDGSGHAKYNDSTLELRISDLSVQITNTPFAPDESDSEQKFTGIATYTLIVPLSFGWQHMPPLEIPMKVKAGYTAKF